MESWQTSLNSLLDGLTSQQTLLIGSDPELLQRLSSQHELQSLCVHSEQEWQAAFPETRRIDCAVLIGLLENLQKPHALHILASLRDIHAHQLIVVVPVHDSAGISEWEQTDFLGMGMKMHSRDHDAQHDIHIYTFSIDTYKPAPDWLNSKYWANPHLFGKFRW